MGLKSGGKCLSVSSPSSGGQGRYHVRGANIRGSAGRVGYAQASTVPVQPAANINISIHVEASGIILNNGGPFVNSAVQELIAVLQTHDVRIGNALQEYLTTYSRGYLGDAGQPLLTSPHIIK